MVFLSTLSLRRATHPEPTKQTQRLNFYPRSPCGERPCRRGIVFDGPGISIHALLAESDPVAVDSFIRIVISIHALLAESDRERFDTQTHILTFLSTLSLRRATPHRIRLEMACRISIHALLAESDSSSWSATATSQRISIHALLAESDHGTCIVFLSLLVFLSTLSLRRATRKVFVALIPDKYFYPRSPCGERPRKPCAGSGECCISIHALLAESDHTHVGQPCTSRHFYPRSPCGERLAALHVAGQLHNISIHALLAESDHTHVGQPCTSRHFYPRSPCGERLAALHVAGQLHNISIHALLAESDLLKALPLPRWHPFLSTLSLRRATAPQMAYRLYNKYFYPRSPCGERQEMPSV